MNIPNPFDVTSAQAFPALVINLARREDRLMRIKACFTAAGLELVRVDAVDAESPNFSPISKFLSPPEEACWQSHQFAMQTQVTQSLEFALVLEDDADITNSIIEGDFLRRICREMRTQGIHILQLGHLHNQYRWWYPGPLLEIFRDILGRKISTLTLDNGVNVKIVRDSFRSGAHAYIVTIEAASELIKLNLPAVFSADDFLGLVAKSTKSPLRVARVRTSLINQWARRTLNVADLDSDIAPLSKAK